MVGARGDGLLEVPQVLLVLVIRLVQSPRPRLDGIRDTLTVKKLQVASKEVVMRSFGTSETHILHLLDLSFRKLTNKDIVMFSKLFKDKYLYQCNLEIVWPYDALRGSSFRRLLPYVLRHKCNRLPPSSASM